MSDKVTASTKAYTIRHKGGVWHIEAKDFPNSGPQGTFRVYRIEGDINRVGDLGEGIKAMLLANGITARRVELNF